MITEFQGEYRFLSNFWPAKVTLDGVVYPTVEHAYQAAKCANRSDRTYILSAATPGEAKRRGRHVALRRDWERVRLEVMEQLLRDKFSTNPLRHLLIATGDQELVEGNEWGDTFWGKCRGRGSNHLGRLLMLIRSEVSA